MSDVATIEYVVKTDLPIREQSEMFSHVLEECLFDPNGWVGRVICLEVIDDDICGILVVPSDYDHELVEVVFDPDTPDLCHTLLVYENTWRKKELRDKISAAKNDKGQILVPAYLSIKELNRAHGEYVKNMVADVQYQCSQQNL